MNAEQKTLWQTIETLSEQVPFSPSKVEHALGVSLRVSEQDAFKTRWVSSELVLKDGLRISQASLVIGTPEAPKVGTDITIHLADACVNRDDVKSRYEGLKIVGSPRGHSPREVTAFGSQRPWGELIFAFRESEPDCLAYVTLRSGR